jgi:hypothetical protein
VDSLVIDGLHIQDNSETPQSRPYIIVKGHVRNMIVRNSEAFNREHKKAVFLATDGEYAKIDQLYLSNIITENLTRLIHDQEKKITDCHSSHVFMDRQKHL